MITSSSIGILLVTNLNEIHHDLRNMEQELNGMYTRVEIDDRLTECDGCSCMLNGRGRVEATKLRLVSNDNGRR